MKGLERREIGVHYIPYINSTYIVVQQVIAL